MIIKLDLDNAAERSVDGGIISSADEEDVGPTQEAGGPKPKKKRIYTPAEAKKKIDERTHSRGLKKAYKRGVRDTQKSEENKMLEKIMKGEFIYFGARDKQLLFLQDYLQFDGSHLSSQDLAIKFSITTILWNEHKSNNKRKKTFKDFHDSAYYE